MEYHRKSKDQNKKSSEKIKQYVFWWFHKPEDIIILVQYLKDTMAVLDKSRPTELYTKYNKDTIMVIIQTK